LPNISARCILCGKTHTIGEDHKEFRKLAEKGDKATFICDICNNRVRFESEDKKKEKKPI
jgi:uncharacterized protein YlaI